jgi:hypothetical protein
MRRLGSRGRVRVVILGWGLCGKRALGPVVVVEVLVTVEDWVELVDRGRNWWVVVLH